MIFLIFIFTKWCLSVYENVMNMENMVAAIFCGMTLGFLE